MCISNMWTEIERERERGIRQIDMQIKRQTNRKLKNEYRRKPNIKPFVYKEKYFKENRERNSVDGRSSLRTAKNQQRKFEMNIPRKGIARPQWQFPHSCVCERVIYREEVFMEGPLEPNMGPSLSDVLLCTFLSTNAGFSSFPVRKLLS